MNNDERATVEKAALHFASVIQTIDQTARLTSAIDADLARFNGELPLSRPKPDGSKSA